MSTSAADVLSASAGKVPANGGNEIAKDEDFSKNFAPVVQLSEVETKTGEEEEDVIFKIRSKLFRFSAEQKEWKERGTGDVRLLQHKESKKIRLLMRREKTLKICLNQFVNPGIELQKNSGSDRSWVWNGVDYADGERDESTLAIRFKDSNNAKLYKDAYDGARETMRALLAKAAAKATEDTEKDDAKEAAPEAKAEANEDDKDSAKTD